MHVNLICERSGTKEVQKLCKLTGVKQVRLEHASKGHPVGMVGRLEQPRHVQRYFARCVQHLLNLHVPDAGFVLREMHVQKPVHRLDPPFKPGVFQQLLRVQGRAGDIVMPLVAFLPALLELAADLRTLVRPHLYQKNVQTRRRRSMTSSV